MNTTQEVSKYPKLDAWLFVGENHVWCPMCDKYHIHGSGTGHRAAHCKLESSPYKKTGYKLVPRTDYETMPNKHFSVYACKSCKKKYNHELYPIGCPECGYVHPPMRAVDAECEGMLKQDQWVELCVHEPKLLDFIHECQKCRNKYLDTKTYPDFCANTTWFGLKKTLLKLVGYERVDKHPILSTSEAYDLVYAFGYAFMPPCRGECSCL